MCRFVESIRVEHRRLVHVEWHERRMESTLRHHFGLTPKLDLPNTVVLPEEIDDSVYKCRIEYGTSIERISFVPYVPRVVRTLRLVVDEAIGYPFKYEDRSSFDRLLSRRNGADDILIVKDGCLTDTSFSNIVLKRDGQWFTPDTFLLNGTCRQRLLDEGIIIETHVSVEALGLFEEVKLINAMLDWETMPAVSILT